MLIVRYHTEKAERYHMPSVNEFPDFSEALQKVREDTEHDFVFEEILPSYCVGSTGILILLKESEILSEDFWKGFLTPKRMHIRETAFIDEKGFLRFTAFGGTFLLGKISKKEEFSLDSSSGES